VKNVYKIPERCFHCDESQNHGRKDPKPPGKSWKTACYSLIVETKLCKGSCLKHPVGKLERGPPKVQRFTILPT